ncbi:MAG: winged helix-turn-helix domain-containing protein [Vulcanisaeta sp.]|jgi:predicted transcriptional regulator|uniref:winged helix-turn-helix domain-containing protein n=1 Tax=Vulcanisaeta sp. TaxID=2020871 RepID=UPI003D10C35F
MPRRELSVDKLKSELGIQPTKELTEYVREITTIRSKIVNCLRKDGELTVKEISSKTGLPENVVFWHLMTMFKYGLIEPTEKTDDGYYKYRLRGEAHG